MGMEEVSAASGQGRERKRYTVNSGFSLLLLLLIAISLISFASLSLVSARADSRISDQYAARVRDYYTAHGKGQEYLQKLESGDAQTMVIPAGENMQLVLEIVPGQEGGRKWKLQSEKLENTGNYEYDDHLQVMH